MCRSILLGSNFQVKLKIGHIVQSPPANQIWFITREKIDSLFPTTGESSTLLTGQSCNLDGTIYIATLGSLSSVHSVYSWNEKTKKIKFTNSPEITLLFLNNKKWTEEDSINMALLPSISAPYSSIFSELPPRCPDCDKKHKNQRNLYFHYRREHKDPTDCTACSQTFGSKVKFDSHMKKAHGSLPVQKPLCPVCGKEFSKTSSLNRHLKMCGGLPKSRTVRKIKRSDRCRFQCSQCEKSFKHKRNLNRHMRLKHCVTIRSGSSFFFLRVQSSSKYLRKLSARRNICKICHTSFSSSSALKRHNHTFHAQTSGVKINVKGSFMIMDEESVASSPSVPQLLRCTLCDNQFEHRQALKVHMDTAHSGEAVFGCDKCPKSFTTKKSLWQHRSRVHRPADWRCTACCEGFKQRETLRRHMEDPCLDSYSKNITLALGGNCPLVNFE